MKRMLFPVAVLLTLGLLFACGGSMSPTHVTIGVPMSVTIGDTPPPEPVCSPQIRASLPYRC